MALKLITAPTVEPVTLAEAKLQCREDGNENDARITGMISGARHLAEQKTGRAMAPQTWELSADCFPAEFTLPMPPVVAVTSVKYTDEAGAEQTIDPANYKVDVRHAARPPAAGARLCLAGHAGRAERRARPLHLRPCH